MSVRKIFFSDKQEVRVELVPRALELVSLVHDEFAPWGLLSTDGSL